KDCAELAFDTADLPLALPNNIWISPDGTRAIARWPVLEDAKTRLWEKDYAPAMPSFYVQDGASAMQFDPAYMAGNANSFTQLALLDLKTATAKPLLDAPDGRGFIGFGGVPVDVE